MRSTAIAATVAKPASQRSRPCSTNRAAHASATRQRDCGRVLVEQRVLVEHRRRRGHDNEGGHDRGDSAGAEVDHEVVEGQGQHDTQREIRASSKVSAVGSGDHRRTTPTNRSKSGGCVCSNHTLEKS